MAFSDGSWSQRDVRNEERFLIHQKIRRTHPKETNNEVLCALYLEKCQKAGLSPEYEVNRDRTSLDPKAGDYEYDNFQPWFCDPYKEVKN